MRSRLLLLAPIAAAVGIAAACSTFTGDPVAVDGGPEAAGNDAAIPADAGVGDSPSGADVALPPTPGAVECFSAVCNSAQGESCCFDQDAGTTHCATSCASGNIPFSCDDNTDCAPGKICCVGFLANVDCESTCTGERLCHTNSECATGSLCVEVPCHGKIIGACGPVGPYVTAYCKDP